MMHYIFVTTFDSVAGVVTSSTRSTRSTSSNIDVVAAVIIVMLLQLLCVPCAASLSAMFHQAYFTTALTISKVLRYAFSFCHAHKIQSITQNHFNILFVISMVQLWMFHQWDGISRNLRTTEIAINHWNSHIRPWQFFVKIWKSPPFTIDEEIFCGLLKQ